jgi:hypothetical protein
MLDQAPDVLQRHIPLGSQLRNHEEGHQVLEAVQPRALVRWPEPADVRRFDDDLAQEFTRDGPSGASATPTPATCRGQHVISQRRFTQLESALPAGDCWLVCWQLRPPPSGSQNRTPGEANTDRRPPGVAWPAISWSGWPDLNRRPLRPELSAQAVKAAALRRSGTSEALRRGTITVSDRV